MEQSLTNKALLADLKARIARIGRPDKAGDRAVLPFGVSDIDERLPGRGLARGVLHEFMGAGSEAAFAGAATLLIASILARLSGFVLWVLERPNISAPALAAVGLHPDRVIYAEAVQTPTALLAMEEGLRHAGLAGVVGDLSGRFTLTASRRLQLAAEQSGVTCFALRRPRGDAAKLEGEPSAAVTRWRVGTLPAPSPLPHAPETPGLARPRWRLDLVRCRGGEPASWIVEAPDATGHLAVPTNLADRPAAPAVFRRAAGA